MTNDTQFGLDVAEWAADFTLPADVLSVQSLTPLLDSMARFLLPIMVEDLTRWLHEAVKSACEVSISRGVVCLSAPYVSTDERFHEVSLVDLVASEISLAAEGHLDTLGTGEANPFLKDLLVTQGALLASLAAVQSAINAMKERGE